MCSALYFMFRPPLGLHPSFDLALARPLLRIGFPLGASAVIYWAYRLVGSTSVAFSAPVLVLGLYTFATAPVAIATRAIGGIQAVLLPTVWRELSRGASGALWARHAERITLALAVIAGATAGLSQAAFAPLVLAVTPSFEAAIRLFDILALTILLLPMATVPSLVLDSERVNRQGRHLLIWVGALVVNISANVLVLRSGWGAQAVAVNDVWVQFLVVIVVFETASANIWGNNRSRRSRLYAKLALVIAVAVAVTIILDRGVAVLQPGHVDAAAVVLRCAGAGAVWAAMAVVLLRPRTGRPSDA
jgi:O-antigen/teichoic acid export membrane protein